MKEALKRGKTACRIVAKDWLEDSMLAKRKLSEGDFSLDKELKKARAKKVQQLKIVRGLEKAERAVNPSMSGSLMTRSHPRCSG